MGEAGLILGIWRRVFKVVVMVVEVMAGHLLCQLGIGSGVWRRQASTHA